MYAKPKSDYYKSRIHTKVHEADLDQKMTQLERGRIASLNQIQDEILLIRDELRRVELDVNKTKSARHKNSVNEHWKRADSAHLPSISSPVKLNIGSKYDFMSKEENSSINRQSFEKLKAKYRAPEQRASSAYDTLLMSGLDDPDVIRRDFLRRLKDNNMAEVEHNSDSRGDDGKEEHGSDDDPRSDKELSDHSSTRYEHDPPDDACRKYRHVINSLVRLPRVSDVPASGRQRIPTTATGDKSEAEIDELKCCRYLRGYEPCYMRMPSDVVGFVFRKS